MKHYGLTQVKMVKRLQESGIAGDLTEKADRVNRKLLLLGKVRSTKNSPRFPIGPMLKDKNRRSRHGVTIQNEPKTFNGVPYTNKAERKALKRAKVARMKALQEGA